MTGEAKEVKVIAEVGVQFKITHFCLQRALHLIWARSSTRILYFTCLKSSKDTKSRKPALPNTKRWELNNGAKYYARLIQVRFGKEIGTYIQVCYWTSLWVLSSWEINLLISRQIMVTCWQFWARPKSTPN